MQKKIINFFMKGAIQLWSYYFNIANRYIILQEFIFIKHLVKLLVDLIFQGIDIYSSWL